MSLKSEFCLGLLMQKRAVGFRAALGLTLPVAGGHIPLLGPNLHVSEDAVVLGAVTLLQIICQTLFVKLRVISQLFISS